MPGGQADVVTPLVLPTVAGWCSWVVVGVGEMGQRPVSVFAALSRIPGGCCMPRAYWGQRQLPRQQICQWPPLECCLIDVDSAYQRLRTGL